MENNMLNGMMGLVVGDAMGVPYEFLTRNEMKEHPCMEMIGHGTYNQPRGSWSDDSSMAVATLYSLKRKGLYDPDDIMIQFISWYDDGAFTPNGIVFDVGMTCEEAIENYKESHNTMTCGINEFHSNGNGSLIRILPLCIFCVDNGYKNKEALSVIEDCSALTHAHDISKIACGIYYFIVKGIISFSVAKLDKKQIIQNAINQAWEVYEKNQWIKEFKRLKDIGSFYDLRKPEIRSDGYVVNTLESVIWTFLHTDSYKEDILMAVNLGYDTDTVACVTGGIAGLYYGIENIPREWINSLAIPEYVYNICK